MCSTESSTRQRRLARRRGSAGGSRAEAAAGANERGKPAPKPEKGVTPLTGWGASPPEEAVAARACRKRKQGCAGRGVAGAQHCDGRKHELPG